MENQKKKSLKEKQEDLAKKIKANSKDVHYAESLLSDFKALSIQSNIKPTCVYIEQDDDAIEINTGAYTFTKTSGVIVFSINGFKSIIYPMAGTNPLPCYSIVEYLFEIKDVIDNKRYDEVGLSEKEATEMYQTLSAKIPLILQMPTITLPNAILMNASLELITSYLSAVFEKINNHNKGNAAMDYESIMDMKETDKVVSSIKESMKESLENEEITS